MGACNCSMFCCTILNMPILVLQSSRWEERELVALFNLSSWCLVIDVWLFLAVPWICQQFVIVVFHDHSHLLFFIRVLRGALKWIKRLFLAFMTNSIVTACLVEISYFY